MIIARILAAHGVHGEVAAAIQTDFPERFSRLKRVYLQLDQEAPRAYQVEAVRLRRGRVLLKLAGVDDIEAAGQLRNASVSVPFAEAVSLPQDRFYWRDIIGLQVFTTDGTQLGKVEDILRTGVNDVYLVRTARGELLIPAIEDVVKRIDIAEGRMIVELLPGMLD